MPRYPIRSGRKARKREGSKGMGAEEMEVGLLMEGKHSP